MYTESGAYQRLARFERKELSLKDPSGNALSGGACTAAQFANGQCSVSFANNPLNSANWVEDSTSTVLINMCLPGREIYITFFLKSFSESQFGQCPGPILMVPNQILVGLAEAVVTANSVEDCLAQCIAGETILGRPCLSGNFTSYFEFKHSRFASQECFSRVHPVKTAS